MNLTASFGRLPRDAGGGARDRQRGSALVMAVFVVALLTGLGVALLFLSQSVVRQTRAGLRAKKAFYMAEAGLEYGRIRLYQVNGDGSFDDDLVVAAGPDGVMSLDPDAVTLTWNANGTPSGITGAGDDVPLRNLAGLGPVEDRGWYAAFLTNDPVDGIGNLTDTNRRLMVTALGAGPRRSTEKVQAIIEPFQYVPPVPPAAITLLGPLPRFDNGNSAAQAHTGNNCGNAANGFAPIVGTVNAAARGQVQADMLRPDKFTSGSPPFVGDDTIGNLNDASDPIVLAGGNGTLDPFWGDCDGLKRLVEFFQLAADYYCNSDVQVCDTFPASSPDDIIFIDGDLVDTPDGHFAGVLVVTGQLTYDGNTGWDGIILAVGEGHILRNGGGGANPSGAVILANIDPSPDGPRADKDDWCSSGFQQAWYESQGGGNSTVEWCTSNIDAANSVRTYRVVQFLQR